MDNQVIVISRQFGSGGRKIGKILSDRLQIPYYDMALIEIASKRSESDYASLLEVDEKKINRKWYEFSMEVGLEYRMKKIPMNEELFSLQAEIIKDLAAQSPCIIIGRGADYILRDNRRMLSVFIHADMEYKKKHCLERGQFSGEDAEDMIRRRDKLRADHYRYYTDEKWGASTNYHLCLDSSVFGIEKCVSIIEDACKGMYPAS